MRWARLNFLSDPASEPCVTADQLSVTVLREHGDDVLACLLMLRAAGPAPSAPLEELARDCERRRLAAITERRARADGNWSVPWSGGCGCELCGSLGEFLADRGERTLEWPLAEARRKHVKDQISAAELPVKHEIWKFGSPHTLVLAKTDELFRREAKARKDRHSQPGMAGRATETVTEEQTRCAKHRPLRSLVQAFAATRAEIGTQEDRRGMRTW